MALLTSRTLATGVTGTDLIHIVITGDTSQNPAGSSYKANIDQVKDYLSSYFVNSTGNTSASCITDLYVTNVYGCSPITIHDSIQMSGSGNIGVLSAAFGSGSESIGDYSFVQGASSATGEYGYNSTSIVSGVITLDAIYGDVTTEFNTDIVLDDFKYDNLYGVIYARIGSIIFNGTNTVITLNDASITTTQAHIGSDIFTTPSGSDVFVGGHFSNAKGKGNFSIAIYSHSEGSNNKTFGANSHSEGESNISRGIGSHSEGYTTVTIGNYSHSEGYTTTSSGNYSHAEGHSSNSLGLYSHAEGYSTTSQGEYSHSEGNQTNSEGQYSHSEGASTISEGTHSHAEGSGSRSYGDSSHAEGSNTQSRGAHSHSEGETTISFGDYSHAEGISSKTGQYGYYSSGISLGVIDLDSSYGDVTSEFGSEIVFDDFLYDNIYSVTIFSVSSVTFDSVKTIITLNNTTVSTTQARIGVVGVTSPVAANQLLGGYYSHSEGNDTLSLGPFSHSQGKETTSLKLGSFSSGFRSNAFGDYSFIHSYNSTVNGTNSVVLGGQNITGNTDDTVYVPYLNIRDLATGTSVNNLGVDSQGNVVVGTTGDTNVFVTGATYNDANTFTFTNNTGGTFDVSFDTVTGLTASTFNLNGSQVETSWTSYVPVWTASGTNPVINNGTIEGWYKVIGKTCFVRGNIVMGSTTTFGSGEWYVSMPVTAAHADAILMTVTLLDNGSAWYNATMAGARAGFNTKAPMQYVNFTNGTASDVNSTQPFTWASSDRFVWNGSYEIA
jgi:hypothetical protein